MSLDKVKNILLVLSGKGGVGKSSITTQLALSLSLQGHAVGILDIDLTGPSIPRFLGIENEKIKQAPGGWLPVEVHPAQTLGPAPPSTYPGFGGEISNVHVAAAAADKSNGDGENSSSAPSASSPPAITAEGNSNQGAAHPVLIPVAADGPVAIGPLYAMSLAFLLASRSSAIVWRGPKKTAMVRQFLSDVLWPELDYLIIDTPPGTSDEHISVVETLLTKVGTVGAAATSTSSSSKTVGPSRLNLAGAVIVTTPQAVAVADVRKEINFCAKTKVPIIGVVENMSGYVCPCCGVATSIFSKGGGKVMAEEFGVPFLGAVPIDGLWGQLVEEGVRPIYGVDQQEVEQEDDDSDNDEDKEAGDMEDRNVTKAETSPLKLSLSQQGQQRDPDPDLLVDKYRNCSLAPTFAAITKAVIQTVTKGAAVVL